jgi:hypothetical protein
MKGAIILGVIRHRSRYILALTLVATTLCADRLFASNRALEPEARQPMEKLVARLTRTFGHVVSPKPLVVERRIAVCLPTPVVVTSTDRAFSLPLSPFEFRLPPPVV